MPLSLAMVLGMATISFFERSLLEMDEKCTIFCFSYGMISKYGNFPNKTLQKFYFFFLKTYYFICFIFQFQITLKLPTPVQIHIPAAKPTSISSTQWEKKKKTPILVVLQISHGQPGRLLDRQQTPLYSKPKPHYVCPLDTIINNRKRFGNL